MGANAILSVQQFADTSLQRAEVKVGISARRIAQLKKEAIDVPERRDAAIQTLESYAEQCRDAREARAACRAITIIMAVSMLEMLQRD